MPSKNPFAVLGLSPDSLRGLSNEQIEVVITAIYRAFQKIHHPDKQGSLKKATRLNEAYEALNRSKYPEAFEQYKRRFLQKSSLKKRVAELETALEETEGRLDRLFEALIGFIETYTYPNENNANVLNVGNYTLHMYDIVRQLNTGVIVTGSSASFFKLTVVDDRISEHRGEKTKLHPKKKLAGCFKVTEENERNVIEQMFSKVDRPSLHGGGYKPTKYTSRVGLGSLRPFVHLLTPQIKPGYLLFSAIKGVGNRLDFLLEGRILRIDNNER